MKGMRNIAPFGLRMTDELKSMIASRAEKNGRSMNAEIVHTLIDSLDDEIKDAAESESSKIVVMFRELRRTLPKNESELRVWNEKMTDLSFYYMSKLTDFAKNSEALTSLREEAIKSALGNKKPT